MGREPGIGPAQLTCPNTDTDHSDQSVPVLFAPLFLEGRPAPGHPLYRGRGGLQCAYRRRRARGSRDHHPGECVGSVLPVHQADPAYVLHGVPLPDRQRGPRQALVADRPAAEPSRPLDDVRPIDAPTPTGAIDMDRVFERVDSTDNRLIVLDPRRWALLNGKDALSRDEITGLLGLGPKAMRVDNAASCVVACVNAQRRDVARKRAGEALAWRQVIRQINPDEVDELQEANAKLEEATSKLQGRPGYGSKPAVAGGTLLLPGQRAWAGHSSSGCVCQPCSRSQPSARSPGCSPRPVRCQVISGPSPQSAQAASTRWSWGWQVAQCRASVIRPPSWCSHKIASSVR